MTRIYLDYNASTPVDPRVLEAMLPYFTDCPGNASSVDHVFGHEARQAVERAREQVASLAGTEPEEIAFTSGATEANNIALLGSMTRAGDGADLIVGATEHPSILEPAQQFTDHLTVLPVDTHGLIDPAEVKRAITSRTALVSVMTANNETGTIQPIGEIAAMCSEAGVPFHTDAVQAAARMPVDLGAQAISLASLSAHKMYGPKGIGALFIRRRPPRPRLRPITFGGGHERDLRPGTLNVPAIVGFGQAAQLVRDEGSADWDRETTLRDLLLERLREVHPAMTTNDAPGAHLPQTVSACIPGIDARALMRQINSAVAISTGSACSTISVEPSHVLLAQGRSPIGANETVRISFGRWTSEEELERAVQVVESGIRALDGVSGRAAAA